MIVVHWMPWTADQQLHMQVILHLLLLLALSMTWSFCLHQSRLLPLCNSPMQSDDIMNAPIFHNADITLVTSLLLIMSFALKHNLTDAALHDLLQLIAYFVQTPNICITSLYSFKKFFNTTQQKSTRIYYCKNCKSPIEDLLGLHCSSCKEQADLKCYFLNISIADQIKKLFSRPGFFTSLQHRFTRTISPGYMGDVYDGALYRYLSRPGAFLS